MMPNWSKRGWGQLLNDYKCSQEIHAVCNNSALCHLCDGSRLYKNKAEEHARKMKQREQNKLNEKHAAFRTYKDEKKEGMAFENAVTNRWNAAFKQSKKETGLFKQSDKKIKIQKPRIGAIDESDNTPRQERVFDDTIMKQPSVSLSSLGATTPKNNKPIVDARRQVNSGALWYAKGDVKTQEYLMECKERGTVNASGEKTISIPKSWLVKQEEEAFQENRPFWLLPFRYKNDNAIYLVKSFDQEIEMYQEIRRLRDKISELTSEFKESN